MGNSYSVSDARQWLKDTFQVKLNPICQSIYQVSVEIARNSVVKLEASNQISANSILQSGTNVMYDMAHFVELTAGFQAKNGAYIDGCCGLLMDR